MSERQREILELFAEAQRLGYRKYHLAAVEGAQAHLFFRGEVSYQANRRRLLNAETKRARRRLPELVPTPPERVEPCICGAAWEYRTGSKQVIHIGVRTKDCARRAA